MDKTAMTSSEAYSVVRVPVAGPWSSVASGHFLGALLQQGGNEQQGEGVVLFLPSCGEVHCVGSSWQREMVLIIFFSRKLNDPCKVPSQRGTER